MPLPPPVEREQQHSRQYDFRGFQRADGLWDIEGHLVDTKTYGFDNDHRGRIEAGDPIHNMWIRLTIDEDLVVRDVEAATEAGPYAACPEVTPNYKRLIGVKIGLGWRRAISEKLGGVEGCTHLRELLATMATVAYQTLYPVLAKKARPGKPALIDTCHAYRSDGEAVRLNWPDYYTGAAEPEKVAGE